MRIVSLASGSRGNAYCVEAEGQVILIDCGLGIRELEKRFQRAGLDPEQVVAVLFTHDHDDHTKGIEPFHRRHPKAELYANLATGETIAREKGIDEMDFIPFENGQPFGIGPFTVRAFSIPHDAADPVGYLIAAGGETYFHATDVGTPLDSVGVKLAEADRATLESNHDPVMLHQSNRPDFLKQRIRGPRGHLANDAAAELVRRFASPRLKELNLAHLSGECNVPHLATGEMAQALQAIGRAGSVAVRVFVQDEVVG